MPVRPLRVLYAEDMVELQKFVALVLTRAGHHVETADDGEAAYERLKETGASFDLLLTDHQMPHLNGLELTHLVRHLPSPPKIAVFASDLGPALAQQYRNAGASPILTKPISPSVLRNKIEELFLDHDGQPV